MKDNLDRLKTLLNGKRLTLDARNRLERDLNAVYQRLEKNEYETSGIVDNFFDVSEKSKQLYALLETYTQIAKTWCKVLDQLPVHKYEEVLDICPGYAPKIEIALFYLRYKGKVFVMDQDMKAISGLIKFTKLFNPQFKIIPFKHDLFKPVKNKFSFVIGNHVIDDLILNYFGNKMEMSSREIYKDEAVLIATWNKIIKNEQRNRTEIIEKLAQIFTALIKENGYLCLTQYKGYLERMLNLDKPHMFSKSVLVHLVKKLYSFGFVDISGTYTNFSPGAEAFKKGEVVVLKKESKN